MQMKKFDIEGLKRARARRRLMSTASSAALIHIDSILCPTLFE